MRHRGTSVLALAVTALLGATLHAGETEDYLARNLLKLEPGAQFRAGLLDPGGKRIFLLGEHHAIAGVEELDLSLLQYLHRVAGVRFYVAEYGYAFGEMANRYFESGDEKLLDWLMEQMKGSPAWTHENREFLKKMGEWNRSLPAGERVRVVGVDVEHQSEIAWRYLAGLTGDAAAAPAAIRDVLGPLARGEFSEALNRRLAASLSEHRADYAALLGDRLFDFEIVAGNLVKRDEFYRPKHDAGLRDRVMYDTFRRVAARHPGARWYGRWGNGHITQRPLNGYSTAASLLEADAEWSGRIVSIYSLYRNCSSLDPSSYGRVPANDNPGQTSVFAAGAGESRFTLFRLDLPGSPLRDPKFALLGPGSGAVTGYAQYVMLVQNASAAHPLHDVGAAVPDGPVVAGTDPKAGASDVPADLSEIRITFSREMSDGAWSFVNDDKFPPPIDAGRRPHFEPDHRTISLPVKLEPGKTYGVWINSEQHQSFRDVEGRPAVPFLLVFRTRAR